MNNFTLEEFSEFLKREKQIVNELSGSQIGSSTTKAPEPSQIAIENLLAYSKIVSVRSSKILGKLKMVLN